MQLKTTRAIHDYWNRVRAGKAAPSRSDLKPGPISAFLPDMFILQWNADSDITFRLAGTRVCTLLGRELKDRSFTGIWAPQQGGSLPSLVRAVAENTMPVVVDLSGFRRDQAPLKLEMLLLPIATGDGVPNRLLGCLAPENGTSWQRVEVVGLLRLEAFRPVAGAAEPARPSGDAGLDRIAKPARLSALKRLISLTTQGISSLDPNHLRG